jgi:hypothetical protein
LNSGTLRADELVPPSRHQLAQPHGTHGARLMSGSHQVPSGPYTARDLVKLLPMLDECPPSRTCVHRTSIRTLSLFQTRAAAAELSKLLAREGCACSG